MKILAIETSCDETSAAIVENGVKILSQTTASSQNFHAKTAGIIPETASRQQLKYILPVIQQVLKKTNLYPLPPALYQPPAIDSLAVTTNPGLISSLLVGVETAKTLAFLWKKPLIPINHLLAHIYANFLHQLPVTSYQLPSFPAICLIASGGHTELLFMKNHKNFQWLGGTRDDAAGECFDKCARLLGLNYPGGPEIESQALKSQKSKLKSQNFHLPRPMLHSSDFDFSFSGLKTAVLHQLPATSRQLLSLSFEIQEAITDVLVQKTLKAAQKYQAKSILISGGVSANQRLRQKFQTAVSRHLPTIKFFAPPKNLCTDNAAMVASCAYFNFHPVPYQKITALPTFHLS